MVQGVLRWVRLCAAGALLCLVGTAGAAEAAADAIERELRGRPADAVAALQALVPTLQGADRVEALLMQGLMGVRRNDLPGAEAAAVQLDALATAGQPLAPGVAAVLRARAAARTLSARRAERLLGEAMARLPAGQPKRLRLRLLEMQSDLKLSLGQIDLAVALGQQAVALSDEAPAAPLWLRAELRNSLAYALLLAQQVERGVQLNAEAHALAQASGDRVAQSHVATVEAILQGQLGHTEAALRASEAAVTLARAAGAKTQEVLAIGNLADFYLRRADWNTALRLSLQALPLAREIHDRSIESLALTNAGLATLALGRHDEGRALVNQALMIEESTGSLTDKLGIQQELGHMLERVGLLSEAWATLSEHRQLADQLFQQQHQQAVLEAQEGFDADRRQRELAALQTANGLQEAQLTQRDLQHRLWAVGLTAGVLLLAVVGLLLHRMRRSNRQLQHSNAQLEVASGRDPLTGLANRRQLLAVMARLDAAARFEGSMLLIDLDHFKWINDQHGHAAGDRVLVEVAARLRRTLRDEDLTVRWGGEEFLVVLQAMSAAEVEALAERVLAVIAGAPVALEHGAVAVTASIGFATFPLQPALRPLGWEGAIDLVDTAMYLAKAHGRNRAYGVRALHDEAESPSRQPERLEAAWRHGRVDLAQLAGPEPVLP